MQYREEIKKMCVDVKKIIKKSKVIPFNNIQLYVMENYGFSELVVKKYLKRLELFGIISFDGEFYSWREQENGKEMPEMPETPL